MFIFVFVMLDVFEIIAQYIVTDTDMDRFLLALPTTVLSERLQSLRELFRLNALDQVAFDDNTLCYCTGHVQWEPCYLKLWPTLCTPCYQLRDNVHALLRKCMPLYAAIHTHLFLSDMVSGSPMPEFCYTGRDGCYYQYEPTDTPKYNAVFLQVSNQHVFDLDGMTSTEMSHRFPFFRHVNHIELAWIDDIDEGEFYAMLQFVDLLPSLKSICINLRMISDIAWTQEMTRAIVKQQRQKRVILMVEHLRSIDGAYFAQHISGATKWLFKQALSSHKVGSDTCPVTFDMCNNELVGCTLYTLEDVLYKKVAQIVENTNTEYLNLTMSRDSYNYRIQFLPSQKIHVLLSMMKMSSLRHVLIFDFRLDLECCKVIAALMPQLYSLILRSNLMQDAGGAAVAKVLPNCSKLQQLYLQAQCFDKNTIVSIAHAITSGSSLRDLRLNHNFVGDDGAIALSRVMYRLDILDLHDCSIGDKGALAISKVMKDTIHMKYLDLSRIPIRTEGTLAILQSVKQCSHRLGHVAMDYDEFTRCKSAFQKLRHPRWCHFIPSLLRSWRVGRSQASIGVHIVIPHQNQSRNWIQFLSSQGPENEEIKIDIEHGRRASWYSYYSLLVPINTTN